MRSLGSSPRSLLALGVLLGALAVMASGCPDKKLKYPACKKDKDCKDKEKCVEGKCQQCATDGDCGEGEACEDGSCSKKQGFCSSNDDCTEGKICRQNQCVACRNDVDCGPAGRCSNGACLARGKCKVHEDCKDDEDCVDGECKRLGRQPPPDTDCQLATVYFGFDASGISGEARDILNSNAECIQKVEGRNVFIAGHTDPRGTEEYNIALSERRAQVVADYLARLGIDPARFRVIPKGEIESTGVDEESWTQDRRVEFEWQ